MASRTLSSPLRRSAYICDSCLNSVYRPRNVHFASTHSLPASSSRNYEGGLQRNLRIGERVRRLRALHSKGNALSMPSASSRRYSTDTRDPQAIICGIAPLPHRRLVSLSGADAPKFLHGLITNSVDSTRLSPFYSAFLDARGRVLWDVFVWVWPELVAKNGNWACYIEVDAGEVEALKKHLKKHKLRSKIAISDVPEDGIEGIRVWAAWGGEHEKVQQWAEIAGLQDPRAPGMYRYLANADRDSIIDGVRPVDTKHYHIQRYLHGVPEGQTDIPRESALPMECNIDLNGGIDFKKGCYVGQELTIRTKHTGVVRKRILPVRFASRDQAASAQIAAERPNFDAAFSPVPMPNTDIKRLDEAGSIKKGRAVGKIVAAIGDVGLALCRLENMTTMRISAEGGTYKPGMHFGVDVEGDVVKVGPVLYDWFVQRKRALWDREDRKKIMSLSEQDTAELQ
ncbi:Aminomethyltransferase folate-binding domain-containing protein [Setomelanomma holmii]|uniref:Iron-sulfur cluster assembly factor IBA57 homolog, mitochondrial n=1 Tax=Setomelanomma holmii TaxID=210430 RepID=A0A9P4GZ13_9PLEO|nr:Aminomethyltransferase folate-binding domain-containing protein [Setomelanomma holmii]